MGSTKKLASCFFIIGASASADIASSMVNGSPKVVRSRRSLNKTVLTMKVIKQHQRLPLLFNQASIFLIPPRQTIQQNSFGLQIQSLITQQSSEGIKVKGTVASIKHHFLDVSIADVLTHCEEGGFQIFSTDVSVFV